MFDAAFCRSLRRSWRPKIVERFIAEVGTENPLAIPIASGIRVILPEPPQAADDARLAQRFVGNAVVRAGITSFPVGVGISDASEISVDLLDACKNIGMGTALVGEVYRIVAHAHGAEDGTALVEALKAWRTGQFEGATCSPNPLPGHCRLVLSLRKARQPKRSRGLARRPRRQQSRTRPIRTRRAFGSSCQRASVRMDRPESRSFCNTRHAHTPLHQRRRPWRGLRPPAFS